MNAHWNIYLLSGTKTWCCPFTDSVKLNKYLLCVDKDCHKKVTPHRGNEKIMCNNPTCIRKMLFSRYQKVINAGLLLIDKEYDLKQITVTLFEPKLTVTVTVIDIDNKEREG